MGHWPDTDFTFFFIELFFPNWSWPFPLFRRKQDVLKKREKTATMIFSWKRKRCYFLNIINLITSCLKKKRLERLQIEEGRLDLVELVPRGGADARPWIKRVKMSSTILRVKHHFFKKGENCLTYCPRHNQILTSKNPCSILYIRKLRLKLSQ